MHRILNHVYSPDPNSTFLSDSYRRWIYPLIFLDASSKWPHPIQICMNSSLPTPPFPSRSNSSIMAFNSSSSSPSPSSLATLLRSSIVIIPLSSVSKSANALRISSLGSLCSTSVEAIVWKADRVSWRRPGVISGGGGGGRRELVGGGGGNVSGGIPWVFKRLRSSGFGRSKPNALRATLNSW